jgi:hypothetical protein
MKYLKSFNESKLILSCSNPECDNTSINDDDTKCSVCGEDIIKKEVDENLISHEYLSGKALEFNPPIRDYDTLKKILNILVNLGFKHSDWPSAIEWDHEWIIGLYLDPRSNRVVWTAGELNEENYQQHIKGYAGVNVVVLNGWDLL